MRVLIYEPCAKLIEHVGVLLDAAAIMSEEGHEIIYLYNSCSLGICTGNLQMNNVTCMQCKRNMRHILKLLPKGTRTINLQNYWQNNEDIHFDYLNVNELKKIQYKGVKTGYSVMSSYISATRNLHPKIDDSSRVFFDRLINRSCNLTDAFERVLQEFHPDRVCLFNSRLMEMRPIFDVARRENIETYSYEVEGGWSEPFVKNLFINCTPHNIENLHSKYLEVWNKSELPQERKIQIAKDFFERRRNAVAAGDRVFVANQELGKLPDDWVEDKQNIVIFNSSEDEFSSLGDEFDKYALFPSQYKGIRFVLETTKNMPDTHVYLRIHPNLKDIEYCYHTELAKLKDEYPHLTVIAGADKVSSYTLMDHASKVVVFGSTIGMESAYWGKPVILLAGCIYYLSDLCYVPHSESELVQLLHQPHLDPKDNSEALKIAFYIMYRNPANRYKYIDFNFVNFAIGKSTFRTVKYLKTLGSYKLYAIINRLIHKFHKHWQHTRPIPYDEDMEIEL